MDAIRNVDAMADELLRLMEQLPRTAPQKAIHALSKGEAFLLNYLLSHDGAARPGEMSQAMESSTARVAKAVGSMERKGWVTREADAEDHRKTIVRLTDTGRAFITGFRADMLVAMRRLLSELGEEDAMEYLRILRRTERIFAELTTPTTNGKDLDQ